MKYLLWFLKAVVFFALFAFALNNQQTIAVNFFFGTVWRAPLVIVVLCTFACGLALGVLMMIPRWWKNRSERRNQTASSSLWSNSIQSVSPPPQTGTTKPGLSTDGV